MDASKKRKNQQQVLAILSELRRKKGLAQAEVAQFFDVRRETVSEWENGRTYPQPEKRDSFIRYFLDMLDLKDQPNLFAEVWETVAVDIWEYRPLSKSEHKKLFSIEAAESVKSQPENSSYFWLGAAAVAIILLAGGWLLGRDDNTIDPLGIFDITSNTGNSYQPADTPLQLNSTVYTDRNFFFVEVPESLEGASYIITANGDKRQGSKEEDIFELKFNISRAAAVCIGYDRRFEVDERPNWLDAFMIQDGGATALKFSPPSGDFTTTLHIYCRDYPAGEVILGPNMTPEVEDVDNKTMYAVIIQ